MKKSRFSEEQILKVLKEQDSGKKVDAICRTYGISTGTFYTWKNKYSGMGVQELGKPGNLESENSRLKKIVANQSLEIDMIKDVISKKS